VSIPADRDVMQKGAEKKINRDTTNVEDKMYDYTGRKRGYRI
jgi:hypothetical protein